MKIFKYLFLMSLVLFIALASYIAILPEVFTIKETRFIQAPKEVVYTYINDYKNWEQWNPWQEKDSSMQLVFPEKTIATHYRFTSDQTKGSITTIDTIAFSKITQELSVEKMPNSKVEWHFNNVDNGTQLSWSMTGKMDFFYKAYALIEGGIKNIHQPFFKRGLQKIDSLVKIEIQKYSITPKQIVPYHGGYLIHTTVKAKKDDFLDKIEKQQQLVLDFLKLRNIVHAKQTIIAYTQWEPTNTEVIANIGVLVNEPVAILENSAVQCLFISPNTYFKTIVKGDLIHLEKAKHITRDTLTTKKIAINTQAPILEIHLVGKNQEKNPALWQTAIYQPIVEEKEEPIRVFKKTPLYAPGIFSPTE